MKKMLVVYPNNFLQGAQGENSRVKQLIQIFNDIEYDVDFFGFENFSTISSFKEFDKQNSEKLIKNLYVYDFQAGYKDGKPQRSSKLRRLMVRIQNRFKRNLKKNYLQDWVPKPAHRMFTDIVNDNDYDVIILFYTYIANLLSNQTMRAKKLYFMEDSMFLQQFSWNEKENIKNNITLGKLLDEELERIKYFDEIFCISNDERIFYEKTTGKDMYFFPHLLPSDTSKVKKKFEERRWDIFFIGFDNPFNVEGLEWFFEKVYPLINNNLRILLVGSATSKIKIKYSNVDIIPYVADLDEIYEDVRISICPMFRGTGMKVKVVESMARGIPIVCNDRGVDGMPDKNLCGCLVTQDPIEFASYINRLLTDKDYYEGIVDNVNMYYKQVFDINKYIDLFQKVVR